MTACAPSENSDQPAHPRSLKSSLSAWFRILGYPQSALRKLIRLSGCASWSEPSLGLSLRWSHMQYCRKCCAPVPISAISEFLVGQAIKGQICTIRCQHSQGSGVGVGRGRGGESALHEHSVCNDHKHVLWYKKRFSSPGKLFLRHFCRSYPSLERFEIIKKAL